MSTEQATKTLNDLLDTREQLIARSAKLTSDRQKISFAAHTGDKGAKERLRKINDETVLHNAELESIDAAIMEARSRFAAASTAEAIEADKANALQLKAKLAKFIELGAQIDDALWDLAQSVNSMIPLLNEVHALGQQAPTSEQFRVNGTNAIKTMLQELPQLWMRDFEFSRLAPNQKKTFKDVCSGWQAQIENNIAARLGENQEEVAA